MKVLESARWIGHPGCPDDTAPVFVQKIHFAQLPSCCTVVISGLGAYVLSINGRRVGEDILQPAFSDYNKTIYYNNYDITAYLCAGENRIEVTLGNVLFNEQQKTDWQLESASWKGTPRFIAEFYAEGKLILQSDDTWMCGESRITFNSLRCGEHYDATRVVAFDHNVTILPAPLGVLREQTILPIRVSGVFEPVKVMKAGVYVGILTKKNIYDFGINLSGNVEIIGTAKRGTKLVIRYFERLLDNMSPDFSCLTGGFHMEEDRNRFQRDEYIFSGEGIETWHSEFGYNGFRYVIVEGDFDTLEVKARCFHTQLLSAGDIDCDNELIMKIHRAVKQSTRTNYHHLPTDCPHREKNGWTGDAHLSAEQAYFNFDMTNAYEKWMQDFIDSQEPSGKVPCIVPSSDFGYTYDIWPCWDGALILIPWQMYRYTGEIRHLQRNYEMMCCYAAYLQRFIKDGLCAEGVCDWLALLDVGDIVPREATITMFCGHMISVLAKIAEILNRNTEAESFRGLHDTIRCAFLKKYGDLTVNDQTFYAMQLMFDFTDDRETTLNRLVASVEYADCHITGGIFCSKYLLDALTDNGRFDLAYKVASQKDFPGWGYLVDVNSGTLGENWLGGQSGNHHMFSEIGAWYYKALAGFRIDDSAPGFRRVLIEPHIPEDVHNFSAYHMTPYGKLAITWNDTSITLEIPEETTASFIYRGSEKVLQGGYYCFVREMTGERDGKINE